MVNIESLLYLLDTVVNARVKYRFKWRQLAIRLLVTVCSTVIVAQSLGVLGGLFEKRTVSIFKTADGMFEFAHSATAWAHYVSVQRLPLGTPSSSPVGDLDGFIPASMPRPSVHEYMMFVRVGWPLQWLHGGLTESTTGTAPTSYWRSFPLPFQVPDASGYSIVLVGVDWWSLFGSAAVWFIVVTAVHYCVTMVRRRVRLHQGRCASCGYCPGSSSSVCPECGSVYAIR